VASDLEAQVVIATDNQDLQARLAAVRRVLARRAGAPGLLTPSPGPVTRR